MFAGGVLRAPLLVRSVEAGGLLETFLIAAVASLLATRFYLAAMGYPQLGGHGLHIAHMLWGGALLLLGLVAALVWLGRRARYLAALLGGVGFGLFIDELGKFITSDNDYFYQPAIALIYIVFVLLFVLFRTLGNRRDLTPRECALNAVSLLVDLRLDPGNPTLQARVRALLARADPADPLVPLVRSGLDALAAPTAAPRRRRRLYRWALAPYVRLRRSAWLGRLVASVFVLHAVVPLAVVVVAIAAGQSLVVDDLPAGWAAALNLFSVLLVWTLTLIGTVQLLRSRLAAYLWFRRAMLVSLLLVQVFSFYEEQLAGIVGLLIDLLLLRTLNYLIVTERALAARERTPAPAIAAPAQPTTTV